MLSVRKKKTLTAARGGPLPASSCSFVSGRRLVDAELAELAVECRAADAQAARDFGHAAAIMADGEADHIGLDLVERAQVSVGTEQRDARRARSLAGAGTAGGAAERVIAKPEAGSVVVSVNGSPTGDFTLDVATGIVTLGATPAADAVVRAGFRFDVPVRFDTDRIEVDLEAFHAGRIPTIPLIEVKP